MNRNRLTESIIVATGLICLVAVSGRARAEGSLQGAPQAQTQSQSDAKARQQALTDDFAGLTYSDEQKAQIAKIHQDTESKKGVVANSKTLNGDQKDAFILGYTREEYGQIYKVLTPEQQKVVRKRMNARKLTDQEAARKQAAKNK